MDSDNSDGEVEHRGMVNHPKKQVMDDTSDVSDDENISHAARSIESPPESPQEAGHFESPPASPESDHKVGGATPSTPRSDEPQSPSIDDRRSLDESMSSKDMRSRSGSPDDMGSPRSYQSPRTGPLTPRTPQSPDEVQSPEGPRSPDCGPRSPDGDPESPNRGPSWSMDDGPRSPDELRSPDEPRSPYVERSPRSPPSSPRSPKDPGIRSPDYMNSACPRSISPPPSPQSPPPEDRGISNIVSEKRGHLSDSNSDDGRSNISSTSSFGLHSRRTSTEILPEKKADSSPDPKKSVDLQNHAEDLSDVSELGSLESVSDDEGEKRRSNLKMENGERSPSPPPLRKKEDKKDEKKEHSRGAPAASTLEGDDGEALDFEPGEEREEGECEGLASAARASDDEGELKEEELEEGELTDEGENRPEETEPRPICRFYNRGQCTWGSQCRFVHPGVTDKGNYTMFEMVRPLVPVNGPQGAYPSVDYRAVDRPVAPVAATAVATAAGYPHVRKEEVPVIESAWERGLRQAKEMLRKSTKRKETEVDFEEKKMNLTLSQDELDKENDLYLTRSASPILSEEPDRWSAKVDEGRRYRTVSERFEDYGGGPEYMYHAGGRDWYHRGAHYDVAQSHHVPRESEYHQSSRSKYHSSSYSAHHRSSATQPEYYERKRHKQYPPREVIVQRPEKSSWKDDSPPPSRSSRHADSGRGGGGGNRADDWADPWMRSKSPVGRKGRSRKPSYSSGSSYSSSSSSQSSRSSSYSSASRDSRSRSRSSRSRSRSRKPVSPSRRFLRTSSPFNRTSGVSGGGAPAAVPANAGKGLSPAVISEKWATSERALHMNPPPPSPRKIRGPASPVIVRRNPTPPEKRGGLPARLLAHSKAAVAAAMRSARSRSKSSHSSSGSDSSGSSSDSSESSGSSSTSSRGPSPSPPVRSKRIVIDERLALAQAVKFKAMDALKLSGQKQQIKLTLKGSANAERPQQPTVVVGKKRPLESPPFPDDVSPPKATAKSAPKPSRREELLKQLKAVEDAIARKRSKIM